MPFPWIFALIIGVAINVIAYLLLPKPKQPKLPSVEDLENPTIEAGRPIPVVFGSLDVKGLNVIWYGDKSIDRSSIK